MPVGTMNQLEMRWVPVTDPNGHTRMESVWVTPSQIAPAVLAEGISEGIADVASDAA